MPINYKLTFWDIQAGTGDVGAAVRAQIAKAALTLQEHPDVLLASSAGGYEDKETPEIALLVPVDNSSIVLQPSIEKAILAEGLRAKVSLKSNVAYYELAERHLAAVERATYIADLDTAREEVATLVDLPRSEPTSGYTTKAFAQQVTEQVTALLQASAADTPEAEIATLATSFPSDSILDEISVTADMYAKMKKARDDDIKDLVKQINDTLADVRADGVTGNTNQAVTDMILGEVVTIGKDMWNKYGGLKSAGSLSTMISGLIASIGGVEVVAAIAAVVAVAIGILWVIFKP
jgi:hypothetical protein